MCCRNLKIIIGYIANVEQKDTYLQKSIGKTNKKKRKNNNNDNDNDKRRSSILDFLQFIT